MAYDAGKAATYNKLIQSGISEDAALAQAGIGANDFADYAIGMDGKMGALIIGTGTKPNVEVVTGQNQPAQVEYKQSADGLPSQQPSAKTVTYTTTSTETVSGGGSTTITAGPRQATEASQAYAQEAAAKQAEIDQFIKDNPSNFLRRRQGLPPLTPEENLARSEQLRALQEQKGQLVNQQIDAETPGTPTVTTVPNTTTSTETVTTQTAAVNAPVNFSNDESLNQKTEIQLNQQTPTAANGTTTTSAAAVNLDQDPGTGTRGLTVADTRVAEVAPEAPPQQSVYPTAFDDEGNLSPGFELDENNNPVRVDPDTPPTVFSPQSGLSDEEILARQNAGGLSDEEILARQAQPVTLSDEEILARQNAGGLSDEEILARQQLPVNPGVDPGIGGTAYDDNGFLNPGYTLDEDNNPVFVGGGFVEPATAESAAASREAAVRDRARQQATFQARYKQPGNNDWRVRLSLAPNAQYLYNEKNSVGILAPLAKTDGVIFPYTPNITTTYSAQYEQYDLVHSNYRGLFYKNSRVGDIQIRGTFTAQDTAEADYLLAVIHFFRSATKMFYGQDAQRGVPPPVCLLNGFGQYQFSDHPVVISSFNYTLPNDVDYIRAGSPNNYGINLLNRRAAAASNPGGQSLAGLNRLANALLKKGAPGQGVPDPSAIQQNVSNTAGASYVPTKMEIDITLIPVQTRTQVSKQFSLKGFANGQLLKGGFW